MIALKIVTIHQMRITFNTMNYIVLTGGWIVYFALHSLLASDQVKQKVSRTLGTVFRYYRLFYSAFSLVGLLELLILNGSIQSEYLFRSEGIIRYISLVATTFGVMTIQIAFRQYKLKSFLGLAVESNELKIEGILKLVRHPIYSGIILIVIGFFLFIPTVPSLISCGGVFAYLPIGIYFEEKKLIAMFGNAYERYREAVPAIIPRVPSRQ